MPSSSSDWYLHPELLVDELRRDKGRQIEAPQIAGFSDFQEIRRGGQGVVYSAIQRSTKRRIAIKVLLDGAFASDSGRRRFEREIDLVAGLRHPHIVTVHDSGVTSDGRLYFVMEFVDGVPLDQFIGEHKKQSVEDTLGLFVKIGEAVNYAHLRGVIHRDLKPGNILVDKSGEPHVCDFGLAKTMDDSDADQAVSVTGQFMGSLPWASPEQLDGSRTVDVRTDVYSLGVILYQALTGRFPYAVAGGIRQAFDSIMTAEPPRPSTVTARLDDEIDTIVLKCLAKDRERRYQIAGELVSDLRHYLAGEPIQAKRDSAWYTLRKTLRRYQVAAAVSGIVVIAASAALALSIRSQRAASRARDEARQETAERAAIGSFLERMLTSVDPGRDGRSVRFLEVLNKAAAELDQKPMDQPAVEAQIRRTLGTTYEALGLFEPAEIQLVRAQEIASRALGERNRATLEIRSELPSVVQFRGRLEDAERIGRATLDAIRSAFGEDDRLTWRMMANLGEILSARSKASEAESILRSALAKQRRVLGESDLETLATMDSLAVVLKRSDRLDEAEKLFRASLANRSKLVGPKDPRILLTLSDLSLILDRQGKFEESEAMQRQTLSLRREVLGEEHPDTWMTMSNLATLLIERNKLVEAHDLLQEVVESESRVLGKEHPSTLTALNNMAKVVQDQGRLEEAEGLYRRTLETRRRVLGPEHAHTLVTEANLASVLFSMKQYEKALEIERDVLAIRRRTLGEDRFDTLVSMNNLGRLLRDMGRYEEAAEMLESASRRAVATLPAGHYAIGLFRGNYGRCLMAMDRMSEAEEQLGESCRILGAAFGDGDARTQANIKSLIEVYEKSGQREKMAALQKKLTAVQPVATSQTALTQRP
ncbi:MAG TPA: serine/threonine-protein kinase [Phycisphaerae bacterium]|nr:serine/threonine-protein kinase [Phycisphaerae bacterium]